MSNTAITLTPETEATVAKFSADTICTICGKAANSPARRFSRGHIHSGEIVEGCVARIHDGHLHGSSARWAAAAKKKMGSKRLSGAPGLGATYSVAS